MKNILKKLLLSTTPRKVEKLYVDTVTQELNLSYSKKIEHTNIDFYSQEGEDLVLKRFFEKKGEGFFLDIGAHHPIRFSNTYHFYKLGWRGINIDAMPGSMDLFKKIRPEDINIEIPISSNPIEIPFYIFKEPALNTFDEQLAKQYQSQGWELSESKKLQPQSLEKVLDSLDIKKEIDFMSIDVEGHEMNVLNSNNWEKYKPTFILIEVFNFDFDNMGKSEVHTFLQNKNYKVVAKTYNTVFYKQKNQ